MTTLREGSAVPTYRFEDRGRTAYGWLEGKRVDDGVPAGAWRIHDEVYDFEGFDHPGGAEWLRMTRGTDITEAFESHHVMAGERRLAELLSRYRIGRATGERATPYTFAPDGFYVTLRRRCAPVLRAAGRGVGGAMRRVFDGLLVLWVALLVAGALADRWWLLAVAGVALAANAVCAHNFFHRRDNWRMLVFDVTGYSSWEWRVSHVLSHHLFPNSIYDLELAELEPFLVYLPLRPKTWLQRYGPLLYAVPLYGFAFLIELVKRVVAVARGRVRPRWENLLVLVPMAIVAAAQCALHGGGGVEWAVVLRQTFVFQVACSAWFIGVGLAAAHHHPDVWHDGDAPRSGDRSCDFGVAQLDAVRDRPLLAGSNAPLPLVATLYGNHALHHLFPTISHEKLPLIQDEFDRTCREFGLHSLSCSQAAMFVGGFKQLQRTYAHSASHIS